MLITVHKRVLLALQLILYILWSSTAVAAQITLGSSVSEIPLLSWVVVFIFSTATSLLSLLNRLKVDTPPRLGWFVAAHMLGSWLAGAVVFFLGEAIDMHDFLEIGAIALASYAGAKALDRWSDAFVNRVGSETERGAAYAPKPETPSK